MTRETFISDLNHWNSYLPLLWLALENTSGPVIELGCGEGSTKKLHDYCLREHRMLYSYDSDQKWASNYNHLRHEKHTVEYTEDWESVITKHNNEEIGVVLVDHAPGERRKYDVAMLAHTAKVLVIHDSEPAFDNVGYRFSLIWPMFKYKKDFTDFPAHATAVSNFIDITKWSI